MPDLYEPCEHCKDFHALSRPACPACHGERYVKTGLTSGQVDMYLRRHDAFREALAELMKTPQTQTARDVAAALLRTYPPARSTHD